MTFPRPWRLERTGPHEYVVLDTKDTKLFYVVADLDGDTAEEDHPPGSLLGPTMLGSSNAIDYDIIDALDGMLGKP